MTFATCLNRSRRERYAGRDRPIFPGEKILANSRRFLKRHPPPDQNEKGDRCGKETRKEMERSAMEVERLPDAKLLSNSKCTSPLIWWLEGVKGPSEAAADLANRKCRSFNVLIHFIHLIHSLLSPTSLPSRSGLNTATNKTSLSA